MCTMDIQILNKNNLLIKSNYDLNLVQNRYYLTILYNMQKQNNNYVCSVHSNIFKELAKNNNQRTIDGIEDILDSLIRKLIKLQKVTLDKKHEKHYTCGIISSYKWDSKTDEYKITLDGMVYDLLINYYELNKGYTPLNLGVLVGLNNYYAQRFYELLRMESWKGKQVNFTIDYLRETFEIGDKYPRYNNFKERVILPSIKVLNETGKFKIDYKENKIGRKVESIDFIVEDLESREYFKIQQSEEVVTTDNLRTIEKVKEKQPLNVEELTSKKIDKKISAGEFFIPDEEIFNRGTLRSFKKDFNNTDFTNEYMESAFDDAVAIALEKDDVDVINTGLYKFFKGALVNKITEYKEKEKLDLDHKKEMDMYWNK